MNATVHYLGIDNDKMQSLKAAAALMAQDALERTNEIVGKKIKYSALTKHEYDELIPGFKEFIESFSSIFFLDGGINAAAITSITRNADRNVLFLGLNQSRTGGHNRVLMRVLIDGAVFDVGLTQEQINITVEPKGLAARVSSQA